MIRGFLAVVFGYVAMGAVVFGGLTGAYLALGAERAFQPGSWEVTTIWLAAMFAVSLIAALLGGWVAGKIAAGPRPVKALATVVLLLGFAMAGLQLVVEKPDPGPRPVEVDNQTAMTTAEQPLWVSLLLPVIGFVGVSIGGRGAKRKAG